MAYHVRVRDSDGSVVGTIVGKADGFNAPDGESIESFDDRESFAARMAELEEPRPDGRGVKVAVFDGLGRAKARTFARDYPDLLDALNTSNWQMARQAVDDAHADGVLSDGERDTVLGLFDAHNIP